MSLATKTTKAINKVLLRKRLFYVCRDIERAEAGLYLKIGNFRIVTYKSFWSEKLKKQYPGKIFEIKPDDSPTTLNLLKNKKTRKIIKKNDLVMVFKPTSGAETVCTEMGWQLINPPSTLTNRVEEKITQLEWLGPLKKLLPDTKIRLVKNIKFTGKKFILQFNRTHTGAGTFLIDSSNQLKNLKKQFPNREARVVQYIRGQMFTCNLVVLPDKIEASNISYQITGVSPFTDNPFATVGNDWRLPHQLLDKKERLIIKNIGLKIGNKLKESGWRGLYGIDVLFEPKTKKVYLIEINARQPASTSYESLMQINSEKKGSTIFGLHIAALLEIKNTDRPIALQDGAQIIQRITNKIKAPVKAIDYQWLPWRYIHYSNQKPGSDLMRLQTDRGIMQGHNKLNENGLELALFAGTTIKGKTFGQTRAGAIIVKNNKVLLMKRKRQGYNYFAIPGGRTENRETPAQAAIREVKEETCLNCSLKKNRKIIISNGLRDEIYFFAKQCKGRACLGEIEKKRQSPINQYSLSWISIDDLPETNLLPKELKNKLIKIFNKR